MNKLIKVLIVEDSEDDTQLLLRELKRGGFNPKHKRVDTATTMKKALKEPWDIILSDYKMPRFSAPAALKLLQNSNLDIPFIIVSGSVGEDIAVKLLKEGAHDFITKINLLRLIPAIERELQEWKIRQVNKKAEKALEESEHRYKHLFQNHPNPMWVYDIATLKFVDVNDAAIEKYGYTREEFLSMTLLNIRPKTEHQRLKTKLAKPRPAIQHSGEWKHLLKNGKIIFVEINSYLFEEGGKKLSLVAVNDITERKRTEDALRESEEKYRNLVELSPDALLIHINGIIQFVNAASVKLFDAVSKDDLIGRKIIDLVHPDYKNIVKQRISKVINEEEKVPLIEEKLVSIKGRTFEAEVTATPIRLLEQNGVQVVARDITERKQAEESLKMWANIFEHAEWGVGVSSKDGKTLSTLNPTFAKMHGYTVEELTGQPILNLYPSGAHINFENQIQKALEKGHHIFESKHIRKDGTIFRVLMDVTVVKDQNGNPLYRIVNVQDITERKRAEEALRENENRMRLIVEGTPNLFFYTQDHNAKITYISPSVEKITGYTVDKWLNQSHWFITDNKINEYAKEKTKAHLRGEFTQGPILVEVRHSNNYPILLEVYESPIILNGKVIGIQGVAHNVTERKQAEKALRESEERYRTIVENVNQAYYEADSRSLFTYCNPGLLIISGNTEEELLGKSSFRLVAEEHRDHVIKLYARWRAEKRTDMSMEFLVVTKSQRKFWVEQNTHFEFNEKGDLIKATNFLRDIDERKRAEEALFISEERYRLLFDRMMDGVYCSTREGKFVEVNPAMVKMFGFESKEEMLNVDIKKDLYFAPSERDSLFLDTGQERTEIFRMRHKDGSEIWVEDHGRYVHDEKGNVIFHEGILRDVTQRLIAEDTLKKSEEKYRDIFTWAPVGIYQSNIDGIFMTVNKALVKILEYESPEDLLKRDMTKDIYYNEEERKKLIKEYDREEKGSVTNLEVLWKKKNGSPIWISLTAHAIKNSAGKTIYYEGFVHDITERKRTENALIENERLLRESQSVAHLGSYVWDLSTGLWKSSNILDEIFGIDKNYIRSLDGWTNLIHPDWREIMTDYVNNEVVGNHQRFDKEYKIMRHDNGQERWVHGLGELELDKNKQPIKLFGTVTDITDKKKTEEAMLKLNKAVESSGEVIFMTDTNGIFTYVNPEFTKLYGYEPDVVIGKSTPRILKSNTINQKKYEVFWQTLLNKQVVKDEFINKTKGGKLINVEVAVNPITDEKQNIIGFLAIQKDVTERKKAEEALKLQTTYFSQLFENSPFGIAFLDTNDQVMNVNKAFENIFQYSLDEIKGKSLTQLIVPEELIMESHSLSTKVINGELMRSESVRRKKDGTRLDMVITGYPIMIEGKCVGIYAIYTDISDIKRLEDQFRQTQKLESIGTLAGGVAHDFNNLLGIILGYTSLLERGYENPERVRQSVDAISKAVHRGAGLVKQILTFARKTDVVVGPVNVNESIEELVKMLNETFPKTIVITQNLHRNLPPILADHNQIHQALLNLSVNARDAIFSNAANGHGGSITFATNIVFSVELRKIFPEAIDETYACLSVKDNGAGMDEGTLKRIFEPFFTTKEIGRGTGLGLAVVYGVVKSHRGYVDVESALGKGTTFNLYFPLEEHQPEELKTGADNKEEIKGGTETILVVEDEEMLQELVKGMLETKGYRVVTANDGEEAIKTYREHKNEIQAVLSDLGLPKLGGFEAFLKMKEINPKIKVVIASGYFDPDQKTEMLKADIKDFVQKPYKPVEIYKTLRKILDRE